MVTYALGKRPDDFEVELPEQPPNEDQVVALREQDSVRGVGVLKSEKRGNELVATYLIVSTKPEFRWRLIWEDGEWFVSERRW